MWFSDSFNYVTKYIHNNVYYSSSKISYYKLQGTWHAWPFICGVQGDNTRKYTNMKAEVKKIKRRTWHLPPDHAVSFNKKKKKKPLKVLVYTSPRRVNPMKRKLSPWNVQNSTNHTFILTSEMLLRESDAENAPKGQAHNYTPFT